DHLVMHDLDDALFGRRFQQIEHLAVFFHLGAKLRGVGQVSLKAFLFFAFQLSLQVGDHLLLEVVSHSSPPSSSASASRSRRTASAMRDFTVPTGMPSR